MRRDVLIGLLLAALTLGVYWPVHTHDFIFYDDPEFILENSQIQSGLCWRTIKYAFTTPVAGNWHPVTTLVHALNCDLFGLNAGGHHLVNVLFHTTNAALLFLLLQQWRYGLTIGPQITQPSSTAAGPTLEPGRLNNPWPSLFAALVFALHPLRVESVAWVAECKDVLSGFFFLLTLCAYTRFIQCRQTLESDNSARRVANVRTRWGYYSMALLSFALGLMSKPMLVTVPFLLLLLDFWPFARFEISNLKSQTSNLRIVILEKVPFLLLAVIDCWVTLGVQKNAGATHVIEGITLPERLANAITSCVRYLGKFFWPSRLAVVYPHPARHYYLTDQWPGWEIVLAAALLVAITCFCLLQFRRRPYLAVGWLWFLGMLVPVIGLIQVGEQSMADRYTYLPMMGLTMALAWWITEIFEPGMLTSSANLGSHTPTEMGEHTLPNLTLTQPCASVRTGHAYAMIALCATTLFLVFPTRHQLRFWQNTVSLFDHAVAVTADNPSAQFALGVGLERQGEVGKAMVRYRAAVAIDPHYAKAYYNMGQLLRKATRWQSAADAYLAADRYNPNDVATQLNLASVLPHIGRVQAAVSHFEKALLLDPDSIEGLNNLAWLLSTASDSKVRDGARAVRLAERACNLTDFKMPVVLGTLAAAYAEAGRFTDAVTAAQNASALAAQAGDAVTASKNQQLLERYRANKPYREN